MCRVPNAERQHRTLDTACPWAALGCDIISALSFPAAPSSLIMPLPRRAAVVCTECHSRKVPITNGQDLGPCMLIADAGQMQPRGKPRRVSQLSPSASTLRVKTLTIVDPHNQSRNSPRHRKRNGLRKVTKPYRRQRTRHDPRHDNVQPETSSSESTLQNTESEPDGQFGEQCYFTGLPFETMASMPPVTDPEERPFAARLGQAVMLLIQPSSLPRAALVSAWSDVFMTKAFHQCPVVDHKDLPAPGSTASSDPLSSVTMNLGLCLVGNMMRHDPRGPRVAADLVEKLSLLLAVGYEKDRVRLLKSLCLVSCWDGSPSSQASLYGSWHWTGAGMRLMLQMGLHRRSTYHGRADAACLRRVFWYLQVR